jgi:hypothetical protein
MTSATGAGRRRPTPAVPPVAEPPRLGDPYRPRPVRFVRLENKNAVIYGAGGAIGRAVAHAFAREGDDGDLRPCDLWFPCRVTALADNRSGHRVLVARHTRATERERPTLGS